jgi:DNA-binding protein HU-beta
MEKAKKPMTKAEVVAHFATKFDLPKKTAAAVVEELASLAVAQTRDAGEFTLPGIGKLVKTERKARTGRNPKTGQAIQIPAKTVIKMRLSKSCKEALA